MNAPPLNILLVVPSLAIGGAEVFVVRLANGLARRGHRVFLLHFDPSFASPLLTGRISECVKVVAFDHKLTFGQKIWWRLLRFFKDWSRNLDAEIVYRRKKMKAEMLVKFLESLCVKEKIQVINAHLQAADWSVAHYFWKELRPQKFVISMHGCYNRTNYPAAASLEILNKHARKVMEAADRIVLLTPKNLLPLGRFTLKNEPVFIPLGFEKQSDTKAERQTSSLTSITFGLVSRAAARKGWEEAIEATAQLHREGIDCRLILVGDGERLATLKKTYAHLPHVHFVGATDQVLNWVRQFDVGLFPSYIESESYPNTVIEYLACGKPVIGTNIGEVKNMISAPDGCLGGRLLHNIPEGVSVEELAEYMRQYAENSDLLAEHSSVANEAFQKFDMDRCLDAYEKAYR